MGLYQPPGPTQTLTVALNEIRDMYYWLGYRALCYRYRDDRNVPSLFLTLF